MREEYIKHISLEQHNVPVLTTTWMAEADIAEDLIAMHNNICDGELFARKRAYPSGNRLIV